MRDRCCKSSLCSLHNTPMTLYSCPPCCYLTRETLEGALAEYNVTNAVMDLVLFDEVKALKQGEAAIKSMRIHPDAHTLEC